MMSYVYFRFVCIVTTSFPRKESSIFKSVGLWCLQSFALFSFSLRGYSMSCLLLYLNNRQTWHLNVTHLSAISPRKLRGFETKSAISLGPRRKHQLPFSGKTPKPLSSIPVPESLAPGSG